MTPHNQQICSTRQTPSPIYFYRFSRQVVATRFCNFEKIHNLSKELFGLYQARQHVVICTYVVKLLNPNQSGDQGYMDTCPYSQRSVASGSKPCGGEDFSIKSRLSTISTQIQRKISLYNFSHSLNKQTYGMKNKHIGSLKA